MSAPGDVAVAAEDTPRATPWYKRRAFLVGAAVAVVVAITVITDLPQNASRGSQISSDKSVVSALNTDIGPCSYAMSEAFLIYGDTNAGTLTKSDKDLVPGLLRDDQAACSFTDDSIFQLSTIQVPGSSSGKYIGQCLGTVTLWATSDALATIEEIQSLQDHPGNTTDLRRLAADERLLSSDRAAAESELAGADADLQTQLPAINLTAVPPSDIPKS